MKFSMKRAFGLKLIITAFILVVHADNSLGHVEEENMPDSVAEMEYRILLELRPGDVDARYKLAMALFSQEKFIEAEKELKRILELDPKHFHGLEGLGLVKTKQKQYDPAIESFRAAITVNGNDAMVYYYLGIAQEEKGLFPEAELSYTTALQINSANPPDEHDHFNTQQVENALGKLRKLIKTVTKPSPKPDVSIK